VLLLTIGLVVLLVGADQLVRSASRLSLLLGISPLVVGLTVVAFGTSAPELAVSMTAVISGTPELALGNVFGSNIFNTLVILGLAAVIQPLVVQQRLIRLDVPVMILVSALAWLCVANGRLSMLEAGILLAIGGGYLAFLLLKQETGLKGGVEEIERPEPRQWVWRVPQLFAGFILLVLGSSWTVQGATSIAARLELDAMVVGLLMVAGATSLPELATSLVAAVRGERDIAVGNVVGSNVLNLLLVLGGTGLVSGHGLEIPQAALHFDIPILVGVAVACLPIFFSGGSITRLEGLFFLVSYAMYTILLIGFRKEWWALASEDVAGLFLLAFTGGVLVVSVHRLERHIAGTLHMVAAEAEASLRASWRQVRKLVVLVTGAAVVLAGIALLFLPGPAFIVIPLGLALLGTEFVWARRLLHGMQSQIHATVRRARGRKR